MKTFFTLIICFGLAQGACADNRLSVLPGYYYFNYKETTDNGSFLDGETGPLYGVSAQFDYIDDTGITSILQGGIYDGKVNYDGHAYPSGVPITSQTNTNLYYLGALMVFPLQASGVRTGISLGYQLRRWERQILSTYSPVVGRVSGLYEVYEWVEISIGAEVHLQEQYSQQLSFYAGVFQTRDPEIEINLVADGDGKPRLDLGTDTGYEFSAQWMGKLKSDSYAGFKASFKSWNFGRSANERTTTGRNIFEPNSRSRLFMLEFVLTSKN